MQGYKKLNLLPQTVKNQHLNRYMLYGASIVCGLCATALLFLYGNIGILSHGINSLQKENAAYNSEKAKMESLQTKIAGHRKLLEIYERDNFPFVRFMSDLELYRPFGVSVLSVDSTDRLINEGTDDENKPQESEDKKPVDAEKIGEQPAEKAAKIEYKRDLSGEQLIVRGYSASQEAISKFIYDVSHLTYITDSQVTAIEQHSLDGMHVNFFEFIVMGGAAN